MTATSPADMRQAVSTLYTHHSSWLQNWLRAKLGNACDAADLTHDTFERVIARDALPELRNPRAFLGTVAHGLMVNLLRRRDLEAAYLEALACQGLAHSPSPEARTQALDTLLQLDAMLAALPAKVREAFLLSQLDGLTHAEIAQRQGVSVSSVRQYIARAMQHCVMLA